MTHTKLSTFANSLCFKSSLAEIRFSGSFVSILYIISIQFALMITGFYRLTGGTYFINLSIFYIKRI